MIPVHTSEIAIERASEKKKGNNTAAFILLIKGLICLQRQNFYYCSRLSACGSRAHLKAGGKRFCGLSPESFVRLVLRPKDWNDNMAVAKVSMEQPRKKLTMKPQGRR